MNKKFDDDDFLQKVTQQLDDSEQSLSADVLGRLRQSRQTALDQITPKPGRAWSSWFFHTSAKNDLALRPLGGVAMVMSVLIITIGLQFIPAATVIHPGSPDDLPLLIATEEFGLYEELEFYQWLEFQDHTG